MSVALGCTCGSLPSRFRFSAVSITLHAVKARHYATGPVKRKSKAPAYDANKWKPKIGLEMHVQLKGNLKLFSRPSFIRCSCSCLQRKEAALALPDAIPNTQVSYVDAALPGTLPVLQPQAVTTALLACLALRSTINPRSTFDRKHYFYPDLPAGYQITQKYCAPVFAALCTDETHPKMSISTLSERWLLAGRVRRQRLQCQNTADSARAGESSQPYHCLGARPDIVVKRTRQSRSTTRRSTRPSST